MRICVASTFITENAYFYCTLTIPWGWAAHISSVSSWATDQSPRNRRLYERDLREYHFNNDPSGKYDRFCREISVKRSLCASMDSVFNWHVVIQGCFSEFLVFNERCSPGAIIDVKKVCGRTVIGLRNGFPITVYENLIKADANVDKYLPFNAIHLRFFNLTSVTKQYWKCFVFVMCKSAAFYIL